MRVSALYQGAQDAVHCFVGHDREKTEGQKLGLTTYY